MKLKHRIEDKLGWAWGTFHVDVAHLKGFYLCIQPGRNDHCEFEVGLRGRAFYVSSLR